jgi:hypothetical protein
MRSTELALEKYNTDKIPMATWNVRLDGTTSGGERNQAFRTRHLRRWFSLLLWRDYFPKATAVGIDIQVRVDLSREERVRVFQGSQRDTTFLSEVARQTAPEGIDMRSNQDCILASI